MGDHLKKVKSGDDLAISAQTFNTFIDAARDFRARQQGSAQTAQQTFRSSGIILVKNASGSASPLLPLQCRRRCNNEWLHHVESGPSIANEIAKAQE